jgi:hypothetical protein
MVKAYHSCLPMMAESLMIEENTQVTALSLRLK